MTARFGVLDNMRGIGALSVVMFHTWPLSSATCRDPTCTLPFGYLAVDMFFVLSGFVISYAYGRRLKEGMTLSEFMIARIVRLYPVFFICALLGAAPFLWRALNGESSRLQFLILVATNLLMVPAPGHPDPFPLVSPAWSLFFELFVANLTYAFLWRRLTTPTLGVVVATSLGLLLVVMGIEGTIDGGSLWKTFPVGIPRVLFGFYAGVLIHRLYLRRNPPPVSSFLLVALVGLTFWPHFTGWQATTYELFCVVVVYPTMVYLGAAPSHPPPRRIGTSLGDVSYALYLIHIPILLPLLTVGPTLGMNNGLLSAAGFVTISLLAAFLVHRFYDGPAREWLGRHITRPMGRSAVRSRLAG